MPDILNKVSTEAVEKATGKSWDDWIEVIDKEHGADLTHKEIAKMLAEKNYIKSGWWCQMVTVGYEYAKGRRMLGETKATGFEIGVSKTFAVSAKKLWSFLLEKEGLKIWLGELENFTLEKGFVFHTKENVEGEVRTFSENERLRLTWKPYTWKDAKSSTLQLYLYPVGEKTSLSVHQEHLRNAQDRVKMKKHWQLVLNNLEKALL